MLKSCITIWLVLIGSTAYPQRSLNVLDWKPEYSLNSYLVQQMHAQYDERRRAFAKALASPAGMKQYIASAKKRYLSLLGDMPGKTALHPASSGTIKEAGYTIEKISYESFPSHHVTANLYIPEGRGPFPAVLLFCGHEDISKATESYQQTAILFAKNGYVVLVVDPVSQSERYQLTDDKGKALTRGGTTEHTLLNEASNLLGRSTPADELWDNVRSLDWLVTRPEVDTARIGCLGNSGGAMQTLYFAGYESRIKVSASCSYLATRERTLELTGTADGCAQMPGEGRQQLELVDYVLMTAPKPSLILAGRYDFIDFRGTEEAFSELKKAYTVLGQPEKVSLFAYDDGHGISQPKREAVVSWFNRWLKNDRKPVHETPAAIKTPQQLYVTQTGQVQSGFAGEKMIGDRNLSLYQLYADNRKSFDRMTDAAKLAVIRKSVEINTDSAITIEEKGMVEEQGLVFYKKIIRKKGEIPLPVLIAYGKAKPVGVLLWCNEEGKTKSVVTGGDSIRKMLADGYAVVLCDLRGTGETEDKPELNDPKYYNREYRNAMLALHNGNSLVGQRTTDILSAMDMIATDPTFSGTPVELRASGTTAIPALYAAIMDRRIKYLSLTKNIRTYRQVLDNPVARDWYSYVVPGVLQQYDISQLEAMIGLSRIRY